MKVTRPHAPPVQTTPASSSLQPSPKLALSGAAAAKAGLRDSFGDLPPVSQDVQAGIDALKTWAAGLATTPGPLAEYALQTLTGVARAQAAAGHPEIAKQLYTALGQPPLATMSVNTANSTSPNTGPDTVDVGVSRRSGKFVETGAQLAARGLSQLEWSKKLGGKPYDIAAARAYFRTVPKDKVEGELQSYLDAFYKHPGNGATTLSPRDPAAKNALEDPANLTRNLDGLPKDGEGRVMTNCVGYSLVVGAIFKGDPRFEVGYVGDASHMEACVYDKLPDGRVSQGFAVDSGKVEHLDGGPLPLENKLRRGTTHGRTPDLGWLDGMNERVD